MSYDWGFWNQKEKLKQCPRDIYIMLNEGQSIPELESIDVEGFLQDILTEFSDAKEEDDGSLNWEGDCKSFIVSPGEQFVRIDCYGEVGDWMNIFVDIGKKYGCPLYDPQIDVRFDASYDA